MRATWLPCGHGLGQLHFPSLPPRVRMTSQASPPGAVTEQGASGHTGVPICARGPTRFPRLGDVRSPARADAWRWPASPLPDRLRCPAARRTGRRARQPDDRRDATHVSIAVNSQHRAVVSYVRRRRGIPRDRVGRDQRAASRRGSTSRSSSRLDYSGGYGSFGTGYWKHDREAQRLRPIHRPDAALEGRRVHDAQTARTGRCSRGRSCCPTRATSTRPRSQRAHELHARTGPARCRCCG